MRRLILVAALCVTGLVIVPVASASAETLTGACVIKGSATFTSPLSPTVPAANGYSFAGSAECVDSGGVEKGTAAVSGGGALACGVAEGGLGLLGSSPAGTGALTITSGAHPGTYPFTLAFVAAAGNVILDINGGSATGDAEFLTDGPGTLTECAGGTAQALGFTAAAAGTI